MFIKETYKNKLSIPRINKLVIESSGSSYTEGERFPSSLFALELLSMQKPIIIEAKRSVSEFKLREGQHIGSKVTLRGLDMYNFLIFTIMSAMPRVSDTITVHCNRKTLLYSTLSIGLNDISIYPQIEYEYDNIGSKIGLNIHVISSCLTGLEHKYLLSCLQTPLIL